MFKDKKRLKLMIKNNILVIIGTIILALGTGIFLVPFNLVTGGMSGISIILVKIIPIKALTVDIYVTILTWSLFILGFIFLGKAFALKTLVSSIVYPIALSLALKLVSLDSLNGFLNLADGQYKEIAILLASIFGGALVGCGCAITFLGGGSTGGTDIIAFILCKIFKKLKSSVIIFIIDAGIVVLGMFVIKDFVISLLGITSAFVCAIVIDKIFIGKSKAFVAQIVSDKYEEINKAIIVHLDRTTTITYATGGYSKQEKRVVMVSFTIDQYATLLNQISLIDPKAFVTISHAHEINGEGWTRDVK